MQEILSVNNELIKKYSKLKQKKYRNIEQLFLIEGFKCVEDAILQGVKIENVFILKNKIDKYDFQNAISVDEKVMKKLADTENVPEILAVAKMKKFEFSEKEYNKIAVFERIKDAGNLGTIIRSACAFGIDAIVLTGDCIDLYNPKVVRSSVGNLFKIPVLKMSVEEIKNKFKNYSIYSTVVKGGQDLESITFSTKSVVLFGSEADGITKELQEIASEHITLKMAKNVESLNLAITASIIFYKMLK
ncbi:RNA methyltransferase [bacterium]|nr:RNA methyltransferase [bacterium]